MIVATIRRTMFAALALVLVGGSTLISPSASAKETPQRDSEELTRLLKEARRQARVLELDASKLEAYNRSRLSWESHSRQLSVIKDHVNALGKTLQELENQNDEGSPWQQNAIEKMRPVLFSLAEKTTQAIEHLRENPRRLDHPEYRETLSEKYSLSSDLVDLLNDHVEFGDTKGRLEELEAKLGPEA